MKHLSAFICMVLLGCSIPKEDNEMTFIQNPIVFQIQPTGYETTFYKLVLTSDAMHVSYTKDGEIVGNDSTQLSSPEFKKITSLTRALENYSESKYPLYKGGWDLLIFVDNQLIRYPLSDLDQIPPEATAIFEFIKKTSPIPINPKEWY